MTNRQLNDSWDRFRYFLAVARTGTLSEAAAQLGTEHTTVGRHIRMLEDELKNQLYHRSNQGYELTEAGQRLLSTAEAVESAVISAKAVAAGEQQVAGTVRVGATDGFGSIFLAPRLGALTSLHPMLNLEIVAAPRIFSLSKREAHIVIGLTVPEQMRVVSRRLIDYSIFVCGSRAYLDAAPAIFTPEDLRAHPIITMSRNWCMNPRTAEIRNGGASLELMTGPGTPLHCRTTSRRVRCRPG